MHPITPPDPLISIDGRRIKDLMDKGLTLRGIARLLGCSHSQLQVIRDDPCATPLRTLVVGLQTLHENVMTGHSRWGRMVIALTHHGWSYDQIAHRIGVNAHYLRHEFGDPLRIPTNPVAAEVEDLYRRHVRNLVSELHD
jgi:hypothetical protein